MADAIPVHSEPKAKKNVKVAPASPEMDENGTVTPGEYAAKEREGTEGAGAVRKPKARTVLPNGAIREDW